MSEYRTSANGSSHTCEFCGHPEMRGVEADSLYCPRCGSGKMLSAGGVWRSRPGQSNPELYDADQNAPAGATEHERRWAEATNDPDGNY